jgi:hypothetical protein
MMEAKCTVIGGHSVRNEDVLFGYSVTGLINPKRVWKNVGALAGDALLFTKPLGTGVISTALKNEKAQDEWVIAAIQSMSTLNRAAAEALHEIESQEKWRDAIHAVTDITGFGLLGHAREMALGNPQRELYQSQLISILRVYVPCRARWKRRKPVKFRWTGRITANSWANAPSLLPRCRRNIATCSRSANLRRLVHRDQRDSTEEALGP